jgi:hypothetical protein
MKIIEQDLSAYSPAKPGNPLHLLFIRQAAGAQLMAGKGDHKGESDIMKTHPNGGGLRVMLVQNNYVVHEAGEESVIGHDTDVCHWNRKFRDSLETILMTKRQDLLHSDGTRNRVVMFQSGPWCNWIEEDGTEPGNPDAKERSLTNYRAAYRCLLKYFLRLPDTLFIAVTPPPLLKQEQPPGILLRLLGRKGRNLADETGRRARAFNNWLKNVHSGWLHGYPLPNVAVFDYYDILTFYGHSNWLSYPSGRDKDTLPNAEGNQAAAVEFVSFINRARNRMVQHAISGGIRGSGCTQQAAG